jgi:hypothetical protein
VFRVGVRTPAIQHMAKLQHCLDSNTWSNCRTSLTEVINGGVERLT